MACPDEERLVELASGTLADGERAVLESHLDSCTICRRTVAELARGRSDPTGSAPALPRREPVARIGRFTLIAPLGRGGMSVVYRAHDPELHRDVAIKLLHSGATGAESRALLVREARALARLAHPNVTAVYEVGEHGEEVFLAMELVEGSDLRAWLGTARPWREVVRVFAAAGAGLAAAHAAGIVHRDVKPANIVLGDDGRVRVLDFGLARADQPSLRPELPDAAGVGAATTHAGAVLGTPAYMAPAQLRGEPADARSDQFSFCVALYEALVGARPFGGATEAELLAAIEVDRIDEPAAARLPRWLMRAVRRGLAADPAQRFASMPALLAELGRERGRLRRRALIALAIVGAAAGGAVVMAGAADDDRCPRAGAAIDRVWNPTVAARSRSRFVAVAAQFGADAHAAIARALDERAASWRALRLETCRAAPTSGVGAASLVERRTACLDRRRQDLAAVVELLLDADAALVERAPRVVSRLPPLTACRDDEALLAASPDQPAAGAQLGAIEAELARIEALRWAGRFAEGIERADALLREVRRTGQTRVALEVQVALGHLQLSAERPALAEPLLADAMFAAIAARQHQVVARAATQLVTAALDLRRLADAEGYARHATAAIAALGGDRTLAAELANSIGTLRNEQGRHDEAIERLEAALALWRQPPADAAAAGAVLNNLGMVYWQQARVADAQRALEAASTTLTAALGPHHPFVGDVELNLGILTQETGAPAAATAHYQRALAIATAVRGPSSESAFDARFHLALNRHARGEVIEARRDLAALLGDQERALGPTHAAVGRSLNSLGVMAHEAGDLAGAVPYFERTAALYQATLGAAAPQLALIHFNLGSLRGELGQHAEALAGFERALATWRGVHGAAHPHVVQALVGVATEAAALGDAVRAVAAVDEALLATAGTGGVAQATIKLALAKALWSAPAQHRRALELARAARTTLGAAGSTGASDVADVEAWLATHERR